MKLCGEAFAYQPPSAHLLSSLQEEGKKLKKFAEKRMKEGRPTHISSMFLCQVSTCTRAPARTLAWFVSSGYGCKGNLETSKLLPCARMLPPALQSLLDA